MKRMRNLLVGILLVALAIGFTGGLRGLNTATQASELDFSKLLSMIRPAVVAVQGELELSATAARVTVVATAKEIAIMMTAKLCEAVDSVLEGDWVWAEGRCTRTTPGWLPRGSGFVTNEQGDVVTDIHVIESMIVKGLGPKDESIPICADEEFQAINCAETEKVAYKLVFIISTTYTGQIGVSEAGSNTVYVANSVTRANVLHDLALLGGAMPAFSPQVWFTDSNTVKSGDHAFVLGYPDPFGELRLTETYISDVIVVNDFRPVIVVGGTVYQLLPWFHKQGEKDEEGNWITWTFDYAILPAPADYQKIKVNAVYDVANDRFLKCEVEAFEAQEVSCRFMKGEREVLLSNLLIDTGNSGGPIFNLNGQVIGIVQFGLSSLPKWMVELGSTSNQIRQVLGI